jgi:hypothetical protein
MTRNVEWLQRTARKLVIAPDPDLRLLATSLLDTLDGADPRKALGLSSGPGPSALFRQRLAGRDDLLRQLALTYQGSCRSRVAQIRAELKDYGSVKWKNDRQRGEPYPASPRRHLMFKIYSLDPDPPVSTSRLNEIIASSVR